VSPRTIIRACLAGAALAACAAACMPMTTTSGGPRDTRTDTRTAPAETGIAGRYAVNGKREDVVVVRHLEGNRYATENPGNWDGVGIFDGKTYYGIFRYPDTSRHGSLARVVGIHRAERQRDGSFKVHGSFGATSDGHELGQFDVTWKKL
jgi:hypothetical protein